MNQSNISIEKMIVHQVNHHIANKKGFVLSDLRQEGRLQRSISNDKISGPGFLDDYAFFIAGLLIIP